MAASRVISAADIKEIHRLIDSRTTFTIIGLEYGLSKDEVKEISAARRAAEAQKASSVDSSD